MSNRRKQDDDNDVEDDDVAEVSGGIKPPDGASPIVTGDEPYPRIPGGPIVKIDPPEDPSFEWKNIYKV